MEVTAGDVDALVTGVQLLGSGGGGDARVYAHVLRSVLAAGPVRLHSPAELGDAPVVPVGMLGGTRVLGEKLPSGDELPAAVRALVRWTGVTPAAVMPFEAAGLNGVLPLPLAHQLGLPLVDADLMGRALPRVDQLTRVVAGGAVTPMALAEPAGQTVVVDGGDAVSTELTVRAFVAQAGGWAGTVMAPAHRPRPRSATPVWARWAARWGWVACTPGWVTPRRPPVSPTRSAGSRSAAAGWWTCAAPPSAGSAGPRSPSTHRARVSCGSRRRTSTCSCSPTARRWPRRRR